MSLEDSSEQQPTEGGKRETAAGKRQALEDG